MDPDFEELSNDTDLIARIKQFRSASEKIANTLKLATNREFYESLPNPDKIKFNLLMSFGLNSLFWMYLRAEGLDPATHQIKGENDRLKKAMARAQEIKDRKTRMPRLNRGAAKRFVRSGLWQAKDKNQENNQDADVQEVQESWDDGENEPPAKRACSNPVT